MKKKVGLLATLLAVGLFMTEVLPVNAQSSYTQVAEEQYFEDEGSGVTALADVGMTDVVVNVKYQQTDARKMLARVNKTRTEGNRIYYEVDGKRIEPEALKPLSYDYELEKLAMQRVAELAIDFEQTRPDGEYYKSLWGLKSSKDSNWWNYHENIAVYYTNNKDMYKACFEANKDFYINGDTSQLEWSTKRKLLDKEIKGFAVAHGVCNGNHYWVMLLSKNEPDAAETLAVDGMETKTVRVKNDKLISKTITMDTKSITVNKGESVPLPTVSAEIRMKETWPSIAKVIMGAKQYSDGDKNIAQIEKGMLVAKRSGTTSIKVDCFGEIKEIKVTVKYDLPAPEVTTNVSEEGVRLSWKEMEDAEGYKVWRKAAGETSYTGFDKITSNTYTDNTAESGKTYTYLVRAYANGKYGSIWSGEVFNVKIPDIKSVDLTDAGISVLWENVAGAEEYYVYRKIDDGKYIKIDTVTRAKGTTQTYVDKETDRGYKYTYAIKAVVGERFTGFNKESIVLALKPVEFSLSDNHNMVGINMTNLDKLEGDTLKIYRRIKGEKNYSVVAELPKNTYYYVDTTVVPGKIYEYQVKIWKGDLRSKSEVKEIEVKKH